MCHLYILYNPEIDKFYVGSTRNLKQRIQEHNSFSHNSKFTRKQKGVWKLVYSESYATFSEASKRELYIKKMKSRKFIEKLISSEEQSRL